MTLRWLSGDMFHQSARGIEFEAVGATRRLYDEFRWRIGAMQR